MDRDRTIKTIEQKISDLKQELKELKKIKNDLKEESQYYDIF